MMMVVLMSKISKQAGKFISKKIERNFHEGYTLKQAVAIAFNQARREGYKVPRHSLRRG